MSSGGPRPNSGRKSNAELAQCHAQMDAAITPDDWHAIYARLVHIVKEAEPEVAVKAARLLIHQRWGDGAAPRPEAEPEDVDDVCEIKFIHVARPEDRVPEEDDPDEAGATGSSACHRQSQVADNPSSTSHRRAEIRDSRPPRARLKTFD